MKKLLVLLVVLGVTTAANAGLIEAVNAAFVFTVDGLPQPPEITLEPSQSVMLDLELLEGHSTDAIDFTWTLSNPQAELLYGGIVLAGFDAGLSVLVGSTPQAVRIAGGNFISPPHAGPEVLVDYLELHCLEETDVVLTIVYSGSSIIDGVTYYPGDWEGTVVHTLLIHQVPEPMTIVLLGLGGLLLKKRRK